VLKPAEALVEHLEGDYREASGMWNVHIASVQLGIVALLTQQAAGFSLETNHIFENEASVSPRSNAGRCAAFEDSPARVRAALFSRAPQSWRSSVRKPEHQSWIYGTSVAQETILRHQFRSPEGCVRARFLGLKHGRSAGLGCWMHFLAKAMELAMRLGRVLVILNTTRDPDMVWFQRDLCPGKHSWDCWFQPITNCTPHGDILALGATEVLHDELSHVTEYTSRDAPHVFHRMLRLCSGIKRNMWFYWWHAQWVAFFVRFNPRTRQLLDYLRRTKLKLINPNSFTKGDRVSFWSSASQALDQQGVIHKVLDERMGDLAFGSVQIAPQDGSPMTWIRAEDTHLALLKQGAAEPLPELPPGSVSVHVRHGDKLIEMDLLPLARYVQEAERLASGDQNIPVLDTSIASSDQTFFYPKQAFAQRTMFVSTEDPDVIMDAMALTRSNDNPWKVAFTQENRTNDILMDMVMRKSAGKATLESFLNLELALEADAWVCTLQSNWCQLIDELRMTIGGKASFPYVNIRSTLNAAFLEIRNSYVYW